MTVKELKRILSTMDDEEDVIVFNPNTSCLDSIESASINNGSLQLNIEEDEEPSLTWADLKMQELEEKGRENWDNDDYEAYCYIEECRAEDEADAEYLGNYEIVY